MPLRNAAWCLFIVFAGCGQREGASRPDTAPPVRSVDAVEAPLAKRLGTEVSVVGRAEDAKLGARIVAADKPWIWLDGVHSWPEGYRGTLVRVTGILIERHDLPVFIPQPGEPMRGGMPVPPGTDLHEASQRYLLSNVRIHRIHHSESD